MPSGYWAAARHVHAAWQTRAVMSSGTASVSSTRLCRILKAAACVNSCCMPASLSSPARASSNSGTTHTLPRPPTRQRTVHLVNLVSPGKKTFVCPRCHSVTTPRRANARARARRRSYTDLTAGRKEGKKSLAGKNSFNARPVRSLGWTDVWASRATSRRSAPPPPPAETASRAGQRRSRASPLLSRRCRAATALRAIPPCITSLPHHGQSNDGVGDQCAVFGVGR